MHKITKIQNHLLFVVHMTILITSMNTIQNVHAEEASDYFYLMANTAELNLFENNILLSMSDEQLYGPDNHSEDEVLCLALNIYFEARSEPKQGQLAVGHVVMNRVANKHYPNTVCEVVQQGGENRLNHCQFSWWCDGRSDKPLNRVAWEDSMDIAYTVYTGESKDPTNGSLWYHADYVEPYWKNSLSVSVKIGQHIFYRNDSLPTYSLN